MQLPDRLDRLRYVDWRQPKMRKNAILLAVTVVAFIAAAVLLTRGGATSAADSASVRRSREMTQAALEREAAQPPPQPEPEPVQWEGPPTRAQAVPGG